MSDKFVTIVHLSENEEHQTLGIRLVGVSVDDIEKGGGRAIFELYRHGDAGGEQPYLSIVQEAPEFRAAQADAIPKPDTAEILAAATVRLRQNLLEIIETLDQLTEPTQ